MSFEPKFMATANGSMPFDNADFAVDVSLRYPYHQHLLLAGIPLLSTVLMAGIGIGLGLAILMLQFDRSFHSIEDLRDIGLPVVGGISMLGVTVPMRRRVLSAASFAMAVLLLCAVYGGLVYRLLQTPGAA